MKIASVLENQNIGSNSTQLSKDVSDDTLLSEEKNSKALPPSSVLNLSSREDVERATLLNNSIHENFNVVEKVLKVFQAG